METKKQVVSIGAMPIKPIVARVKESTAGDLKHVQVKPAKRSISDESGLLGLLQSDLFDLAKRGVKSAVMGKNERLYFVLDYPGHVLGFQSGNIFLDGVNVVTGEPVNEFPACQDVRSI